MVCLCIICSIRLYTYFIFLHHALNLIADFPSVMGHNKVWLLAELVPAHSVITGQLLLQANHELLGIRGSVQSAHLGKGKATQNFSTVGFKRGTRFALYVCMANKPH